MQGAGGRRFAPGTQGMMFWYYVLQRIDDTQAWSAATRGWAIVDLDRPTVRHGKIAADADGAAACSPFTQGLPLLPNRDPSCRSTATRSPSSM